MESPALKRLLANLKRLRTQLGLTQEEFAGRFDLSYKYYQALEAGRKKDPRLSTIQRLASIHKIEAHQLLEPFDGKSRSKELESGKRRRFSKEEKVSGSGWQSRSRWCDHRHERHSLKNSHMPHCIPGAGT